MVSYEEVGPIAVSITDPAARMKYENFRENILSRDQVASLGAMHDLLKMDRPIKEILSETVRNHAPYTHVPYHQRIDEGIVRFVNNDHCLLSASATLRLERYIPKKFAALPIAQTVWYVPIGLDIWNQLKGRMPGHYSRQVYDPEKYPDGPLPPEVHWRDEEPGAIKGTFDDALSEWLQLVERGNVTASYKQWLGMWEDRENRTRLLAETVFVGLIDVQDRLIFNRSFTTGHKSYRARAAVELGDSIGWENARHVIYATIPDLAVGQRWYSAYEAACQIMMYQLEDTAPKSSVSRTEKTDTDRRMFAQTQLLSDVEEESLIDMILHEEDTVFLGAITMFLKAGRSVRSILDAIQIASARIVLDVRDPNAFSMPQHGYEYTNTVAWFYDRFDHPHKTKLLYVAATFVNQTATLVRDMPDYNYEKHHNAPIDSSPQAHFVETPQGLRNCSSIEILRKLSQAMMNLDQDDSVACTQAYLESGAERTSLISTLAMGVAKQGNDPHNQEIGLCMLEDYERTSSMKREELLLACARHTAGHQKYGNSLELFGRHANAMGITVRAEGKTDKNKDEIEALLDDVDYFFEEDNTLVS